MIGIRQVRNRIRSVKNIQQITRAMKMVASARLRRAQEQLLNARPYTFKMHEVMADIASYTNKAEHPLLYPKPRAPEGMLVLTSDKGLCGGFNAQPLQKAVKFLTAHENPKQVQIMCVGRKALNFFRRTGFQVKQEWAGFWQELNWLHADGIGQVIINEFSSGHLSKLTVIYNGFKSALSQELKQEVVIPIALPEKKIARFHMQDGAVLYEPSAGEIFKNLLPRYIKNALWHALLESKAAELAARMQSMDNATESAKEMISDLTLQMNRARQASITREISELVGGAEAIQA
jgi:F-type H+-transporting ATPase subunit gamma